MNILTQRNKKLTCKSTNDQKYSLLFVGLRYHTEIKSGTIHRFLLIKNFHTVAISFKKAELSKL